MMLNHAENATRLQDVVGIFERHVEIIALAFRLEAPDVVQHADEEHDVGLPRHFFGHGAEPECAYARTVLAAPLLGAGGPVLQPLRHLGHEFLGREREVRPEVQRVVRADQTAVAAEIRQQYLGVPASTGQAFDHGHAGFDAEEFDRFLRVPVLVASFRVIGLRSEHRRQFFPVGDSNGRLTGDDYKGAKREQAFVHGTSLWSM